MRNRVQRDVMLGKKNCRREPPFELKIKKENFVNDLCCHRFGAIQTRPQKQRSHAVKWQMKSRVYAKSAHEFRKFLNNLTQKIGQHVAKYPYSTFL